MEDQNQYSLIPRANGSNGNEGPLSHIDMSSVRPLDTYNWEQAMRVLRKNRRFAILFSLLVTALVAAGAFAMKDVYQPTARLEVDPPSFGIFTQLRDIGSAPENNENYQDTQAQILQSEALAVGVIRTLHLDRNPEIVGKNTLAKYPQDPGPKAPETTSVNSGKQLNRELMDLATRTPLESIALNVFEKQLAVNAVRNSRLIEVSYTSHNPALAQQIVNTLVAHYIDRNYKTRYATTMQTSDWLSGQLEDVRQKVEDSTQALVDYQKKYQIVEQEDKDLATTQNYVEANHRWSEARADRLQLESYVRMIGSGQADSLPQIHDNQLHMSLTSHYVESRAQLAQARAIYGDENPVVKKLREQTDELAAQLDADTERIQNDLKTSHTAALAKEDYFRKAKDKLQLEMGDIGERMVKYRILKNDALANTELYHALSARLKEAAITAGLGSNNIHIVDSAALLDSPTGPQRPLLIAIGAVISAMFGLALAFVKESFSNTVRTPDDIREWTGLPSLAMLPSIPKASTNGTSAIQSSFMISGRQPANMVRIASAQNHTVEAEAMRELRTALMLSRPGEPPRVILVGSSAASEGKTTIAVNLAIVFAQHGKTVLVDGDLRRPMVGNTFGFPASGMNGLSHVLAGSLPVEKVIRSVPEVPDLDLLLVGVLPPNPADLVASEQMRGLVAELRKKYDHVVIDSPPAIPFADTRVLSSMADGVVLVSRCGLTTRRAIMRCTQLLDEVRAPIIGVVVNGIEVASADYHYYNYGFSTNLSNSYPYKKYKSNGTTPVAPMEESKPKSKSAHA